MGILKGFPSITAAQLQDAISYYHVTKKKLKHSFKKTKKPMVNTLSSKKVSGLQKIRLLNQDEFPDFNKL